MTTWTDGRDDNHIEPDPAKQARDEGWLLLKDIFHWGREHLELVIAAIAVVVVWTMWTIPSIVEQRATPTSIGSGIGVVVLACASALNRTRKRSNK